MAATVLEVDFGENANENSVHPPFRPLAIALFGALLLAGTPAWLAALLAVCLCGLLCSELKESV